MEYENQMVILHIASLNGYEFSGVSIIVPSHIRAQDEKAMVALLNIQNVSVNVKNQLEYKKNLKIEDLHHPFNKPDLIVFHEIYHIEYINLAKQLKKSKIPYIIIPHGGLTHVAQNKKRIKKFIANRILFSRFINNSIAIQCLSKGEENETITKIRKIIIGNGVHIPEKRKTSFNSEKTDFLYIGRLEKQTKGLDLMIEAAKIEEKDLKDNNSKITIHGPDLHGRFSDIQATIENSKAADLIELKHEIMGEDKEERLLQSDIFIQTSRTEGMPLGILEALSYGIPCLVTKGTRLGEIIQEYNAGWVADTNAVSIANAIKKCLLDRGSWTEKSLNARRLAEEKYSWTLVAEETLQKYKEILKYL